MQNVAGANCRTELRLMAVKTDLSGMVAGMVAAQDDCLLVEPWSAQEASLSLGVAYEVAERINQVRQAQGWRCCGRKIGFTNADMWPLYGVEEPIWGRLYEQRVEDLNPRTQAQSLTAFAQPMLEPEIVLHFDASPSPDSNTEEILSCVDWIAHGFELVQSHFPDWKFAASDTVVDNGLHGMLLLGPRLQRSDFGDRIVSDLEAFEIQIDVDGREVHRGRGANVLGSPLLAIKHLLGLLDGSPKAPRLQAGEMVTTGTLTPVVPIAPGQTWRTTITDIELEGIELTLTA